MPLQITHAFSLNGQHLAWAILEGDKWIENRQFRMAPGWYAVACTKLSHIGVQTDHDYKKKFESYPGFQSLDAWKGNIVGIAKVSHSISHSDLEKMKNVDDNLFADATYKVKNIISEVMPLDVLIPASGNFGTWPLQHDVLHEVRKAVKRKLEESIQVGIDPVKKTVALQVCPPLKDGKVDAAMEQVQVGTVQGKKQKSAGVQVAPKPKLKRPREWKEVEEEKKKQQTKTWVASKSALAPNTGDIRQFFGR